MNKQQKPLDAASNSRVETLEKTEDVWEDLMTLCERDMKVCRGHDDADTDTVFILGAHTTRCLRPPVHVVQWSDRESYCCPAHLDCIKRHAANDGSVDRTDAPHVGDFENDPIVVKYWDRLVKRAEPV